MILCIFHSSGKEQDEMQVFRRCVIGISSVSAQNFKMRGLMLSMPGAFLLFRAMREVKTSELSIVIQPSCLTGVGSSLIGERTKSLSRKTELKYKLKTLALRSVSVIHFEL